MKAAKFLPKIAAMGVLMAAGMAVARGPGLRPQPRSVGEKPVIGASGADEDRGNVLMPNLLPTSGASSVLYVDDDAALGGNGQSWSTAYKYVQDALSAAGTGDEIRVAGGVYKPDQDEAGQVTPGDRTATFQLVNSVVLAGGYAGSANPSNPDERDIALYETTLSGDLLGNDNPAGLPYGPTYGDNGFNVVTGSGTDATAILDGFTISGGSTFDYGGGMYNSGGSPTVSQCTFRDNAAGDGGGMYNQLYSNPLVSGCTFLGNWAGLGGGMANLLSDPTVIDCRFFRNTADALSELLVGGGGVKNSLSSPAIINCVFSGNRTIYDAGGAIANAGNCQPTIVNCTFSENTSGTNSGQVMLTVLSTSTPTMVNCILWGNGSPHYLVCDSRDAVTTITYSNIQGGWTGAGGTGNIDIDPLFVQPLGPDGVVGTVDDNLRLLSGSQCIDAGDNAAVTVTTDLDGNLRIIDGDGDSIPVVDMGAYERQAGASIRLDIKPGGCPNPLNRSSHGFLPVAVVGTGDFDVTTIDVASVRLSRVDGIGGVAAPNEGPPGPHSVFEDVATPFEGEACDCHALPGDGLDDLSMKFSTQDVVAALELAGLSAGDDVELVITGTLLDGAPFATVADCVTIVPPGNPGPDP